MRCPRRYAARSQLLFWATLGHLGDGVPLSPASLLRLKTQWQAEYETWKQRRLDDLKVVYIWADGLYVKMGLEDTKAALLVMIGVLTNGQKVVLTAAKHFKKVENAIALIWKILQVARSTLHKLKGTELLLEVSACEQYVEGVKRTVSPRQRLAA